MMMKKMNESLSGKNIAGPVLRVSGISPWADFKKIIKYYIDCVKFDERPSCYLNSRTLNDKFIFPILPLDWLSVVDLSIEKVLSFDLNNTQAAFLRNVVCMREGQELFLGYPVQLYSTNNGSFLNPICTIPCEITSFLNNNLKINPQYDQADFNGQWLEKGIHKDHQTALLRAAQINTNDANGTFAYFDIIKAIGAIGSLLGDKLKDTVLDPDRPRTMLDLNSAEPGIYNIPVLFVGERVKYNLGLLKELKKIANAPDNELDKTALSYVFKNPPNLIENNKDIEYPLPFLAMNQEQENAVKTSLNSSCTQITGPPGTGKSQAVSNIIANLVFYGKTVIFASKNHKAIEAVVSRCGKLSDNPPIVNCSSSKNGEATTWVDAIRKINNTALFNTNSNSSAYFYKKISSLTKEALSIINESIEREIISATLAKDYEEFENRTKNYTEIKISSIINTGLYTNKEKIELLKKIPLESELFKKKTLIAYFQRTIWYFCRFRKVAHLALFFNEKSPELWSKLPDRLTPYDLVKYVQQALHDYTEFEAIRNLKSQIEINENKCKKFNNAEKLKDRFAEIQKILSEEAPKALIAKLNERLANISDKLKGDLQNLRVMLNSQNYSNFNSQTSANWERVFTDNISQLVNSFPAWASTLLSLRKALPLAPAIVDYTIIDEASQCEIPPIIPALYRAKRVVIVGDPNQFRPVITLSANRHQNLKFNTHGITDPNLQKYDYQLINSFELANSFPTVLLRDHFRCHDVIADYFNKTFYNGRLNVMTDRQNFKLPKNFKPGIIWHNVEGTVSNSVNGPIVSEEILEIKQILKEFKDNDFAGTIGVITPFKAQAAALEEKLTSEFGSMKWNFIASTAHSFQGDERDVIIFSPAFQKGLGDSYKWLLCNKENSNLTNVAVSRARALLVIVGNRELCKTSGVHYLQRLALYPDEYIAQISSQNPFESIWEENLYNTLVLAGIKTLPQFPLAGRRLDLAIPELKIDIEVDGEKYHRDDSGHRKADDLWRDYTLGLLGWKTIRFWVYELRDNMPDCVMKIQNLLNKISE